MIHRFVKSAVFATFGTCLALNAAYATATKEAPWLPEAAAYRLTLFLGNLAPVPWEKINTAWTDPYHGSEYGLGAKEWLEANSALNAQLVFDAIKQKDRQGVYAAATRLIASRINEELDNALRADNAAASKLAISNARELYRSFADHIAAVDSTGSKELGLAWLNMSSSVGSSGILGAGEVPMDLDSMRAARNIISSYLDKNYLVEQFGYHKTLTAAPQTAVLAGQGNDVPATLPPGSDILDQDPLPLLVLGFEEEGIDEADLPLIAYGDMLFDSPEIFSGPARDLGIACSTCHNRSDINQRFFIPGASHQPGAVDVDGAFFNPLFNDRRDDPIDIPSLRGLRFTGPYGRDGRFASLRDFTRNVIVNEFAGAEPSPFMLDALVAYMTEFDFLPNSLLTTDGSLSDQASDAARRGEEIFNRPFAGFGGKSCATCHTPDGNFLDRKSHNIGSVEPSYEGSRSGTMDTPTLLGTLYTAPYFHDGSQPTLGAVVSWFDKRWELGLSSVEIKDLTTYLEAIGSADAPYEEFDGTNTPFRLAFAELTTFASTLDTLLPMKDAEHILLLIDTVAPDLAADAGTMVNLKARPQIYDLSKRLSEVGFAVRNSDWQTAAKSWSKFKLEAEAITGSAY